MKHEELYKKKRKDINMNELLILYLICGFITLVLFMYYLFVNVCYVLYKKIYDGKMKYTKYIMQKFAF